MDRTKDLLELGNPQVEYAAKMASRLMMASLLITCGADGDGVPKEWEDVGKLVVSRLSPAGGEMSGVGS